MLLLQGQSVLLDRNLDGDAMIPDDDILEDLGAAVLDSASPADWTAALHTRLAGAPDIDGLVEHLAGVQFLATVGGPVGARLLSAFWLQSDLAFVGEALTSCPELEPLLTLVAGRTGTPPSLSSLAAAAQQIISLANQLKRAGVRDQSMDLLTAAVLAQSNHGNGQVVLTVDTELAETIAAILNDPAYLGADVACDVSAITLFEGLVVVDLADQTSTEFPDGFPILIPSGTGPNGAGQETTATVSADAAPEAKADTVETTKSETEKDDDAEEAMDNSRLKKLVLDNITTTSVLLEFLRDPKVFAIPGLIEEVVNRTRNPQIIDTVANARVLHTGFANKGVPLACLRSPVNVPVRALRKFIHVRFVSKVDLKRMANDRNGVRKEVGREIDRYLKSLA